MKIVIQICPFLRAKSRDNILKKSILLWQHIFVGSKIFKLPGLLCLMFFLLLVFLSHSHSLQLGFIPFEEETFVRVLIWFVVLLYTHAKKLVYFSFVLFHIFFSFKSLFLFGWNISYFIFFPLLCSNIHILSHTHKYIYIYTNTLAKST